MVNKQKIESDGGVCRVGLDLFVIVATVRESE